MNKLLTVILPIFALTLSGCGSNPSKAACPKMSQPSAEMMKTVKPMSMQEYLKSLPFATVEEMN